jgi:cathepsin F
MNIKIATSIVLLYLVSSQSTDTIFQQFLKFKEQFNKNYPTMEEFITRFNVFKQNHQRLQTKKASHEIGITKYSDLTPEEFKNTFRNGLDVTPGNDHGKEYLEALLDGDAPIAYDWRDHGAVGPVKDQHFCGSCWAFSVSGNLEGQHFIKTGQFVQYSEQQLVDCETKDQHGCWSGWMPRAYDWIKEVGGIETEQDYSYTGLHDKCKFDVSKASLQIKDKIVNSKMDEELMKEFLFKNGPLAVCLNSEALVDYFGGIIDQGPEDCDPSDIDHAVTLVGYDSEDGKDYWIVKNSWGQDWGEKGYFRIARGKNICGINTNVSSAVIA